MQVDAAPFSPLDCHFKERRRSFSCSNALSASPEGTQLISIFIITLLEGLKHINKLGV